MKGQFVRGGAVFGLAVAALLLVAAPCAAQAQSAPSQSAVVNLIRLLVKQKVISQQAADALLKEAEAEAAQAKQSRVATGAAPVPVPEARPEPPPPPPGTVRVPYVPKIVRDQIRDEVKQEVLAEAKAENWAQPNQVPEWTKRITWSGSMRIRDESDFFGANNIGSDGVDGYVNYYAFNLNGPTDVNPNTILNNIPFLNTTKNRINLISLEARLALQAQVANGVLASVGIATGGDNGPVSTTQLLGGGFTKKDLWLDETYLLLQPLENWTIQLGRYADPFFRTDLVFHDTLHFDGVQTTVRTRPWGTSGVSNFLTIGAFPVGYINYNFPTYSPIKAGDHTEWLLGGQIGADWAKSRWDWRSAVSIYNYVNAQGALSAPCPIFLLVKQCSTDDLVPLWMAKGNTLFLMRNIIPDPKNPTNYAQPQFAGLEFNYRELDAYSSFDYKVNPQYHLIFDADYVRNIAYDPSVAYRYASFGNYPVTNFDPNTKRLQSGPNAWMARVEFGEPEIHHRWEWNITAGYKYLQPDAVLDGFTDYDFHNGGTNAKGYIVKASLGIFDNTWLQARWFSANEVYGPPLAIDILQFDLDTTF